jgi:hypothetical protein
MHEIDDAFEDEALKETLEQIYDELDEINEGQNEGCQRYVQFRAGGRSRRQLSEQVGEGYVCQALT